MIPQKLKQGDEARVIAPARSLAMPWLTEELQQTAIQKFKQIGLNISFAEHVNEIDEFDSSSIQSRVKDLHQAFKDDNVKLVIAVIGGFNSNQILSYLDYEFIKSHPKILCGMSDITALANAIYAKTGLITYSGPQFFHFGDKKGFDYTLDYFKKCLFSPKPFEIAPCKKWSDEKWSENQENRNFISNKGYWIISPGKAEGRIVGGNLCTLNLLQGTEFMPDIKDSILFLEDDYESLPCTFDRNLQSLIHQPGFEKVKALIIGRFQIESKMTRDLLVKIIRTKKELNSLPVVANIDFGHTTPLITFPIGGRAKLIADKNEIKLEIVEH